MTPIGQIAAMLYINPRPDPDADPEAICPECDCPGGNIKLLGRLFHPSCAYGFMLELNHTYDFISVRSHELPEDCW